MKLNTPGLRVAKNNIPLAAVPGHPLPQHPLPAGLTPRAGFLQAPLPASASPGKAGSLGILREAQGTRELLEGRTCGKGGRCWASRQEGSGLALEQRLGQSSPQLTASGCQGREEVVQDTAEGSQALPGTS